MLNDFIFSFRTVPELLHMEAERYKDTTAVCIADGDGYKEISYRELNSEIQRLSSYFASKYGVGKIVALPGSLTISWLMLFLSVICSGNIAVPMDFSKFNEDTARNILKLHPDLIFTERASSAFAEKISELYPEIFLGSVEDWFENSSSITSYPEYHMTTKVTDPDATAVLVFTSGTTGDSKIVEITHRNLCTNAMLAATYVDRSHPAGARILSALPTFHLYGVTAPVFGALCRGFSLCIGGGAWTFREDIQKYKPEILIVVPLIIYSFCKRLMQPEREGKSQQEIASGLKYAKAFLGGNLRCIISGGAPLNSDYSDFFSNIGIYIMNGYGITECSPIVSCDVPEYHKKGALGKAGILPDFCSIKIENQEICVKGEIVSPGYWKEPELNELAYVGGWFHTGDLGYLDEDGYLFITGRKKNILILPDGNNISLDEMEKQIEKCPEADAAIVLGKVEKDNAYMEAVIYSNPENGRCLEETQKAVEVWIDRMNKSNPRYKRIADFTVTDKPFERTSLGKIKKYKYSK